jgi:flagellar FliL protein
MRLYSLLVLIFSLLLSGSIFAEEEQEEKKKASYFSLKPSLIANVQGKARYVRCDVQLMTMDEASLADIQLHAPALRHELLLLLGDQKGEDLKALAGREKLRTQALEAVGKVMEAQTGKKSIEGLFFTSFFVQ